MTHHSELTKYRELTKVNTLLLGDGSLPFLVGTEEEHDIAGNTVGSYALG